MNPLFFYAAIVASGLFMLKAWRNLTAFNAWHERQLPEIKEWHEPHTRYIRRSWKQMIAFHIVVIAASLAFILFYRSV